MLQFLLGLQRLSATQQVPTLDANLLEETFEMLHLGDFPFAPEALLFDERKRKADG